jgi:trehalose 2-sulfotransferase
MKLDQDRLKRAFEKVPEEDFVNARYDSDVSHEPQKILIIFSTPRSGSTLLCDYIKQAGLCVPHEYFQSTDYMPILGYRWGCIHGEKLNLDQYFESLLRYRTSPNGWLGINVHGSHLNIFLKFFNRHPKFYYHFIHLERKNTIAQAVSYEKASQTSGWSTYFNKIEPPSYCFNSIMDKLDRVEDQNSAIRCFLAGKNFSALFYEDFIFNPSHEIVRVGLIDNSKTPSFKPSLKQQNDGVNEKWIEKFSSDFQNSFIKMQLPKKIRPKKDIGYYWAKLIQKCQSLAGKIHSITKLNIL